MTTTTSHHDSERHRADDSLVQLLDLTAAALSDALDAVVHLDRHSARRVLAGARERRAAAVEARNEAQARLASSRIVLTAHRLIRSVNTVQLVADLERLEELIVATARQVLAGRAHLPSDLRPEVATLARAGAQRLHDLADHCRHHDATYLACGRDLHEVLTCLARHARAPRRSEEAVGLCAALASGVLEASRHAGRAA
jgi:phosphate uptake regulator